MQDGDHGQVNGTAIASTVAFALSQGMAVERIEAATGFTIAKLITPHSRLPMRVRHALWSALAELHDDRIVSLELAKWADLAVFDGLADAVRYAPDLRAALLLLSRNSAILGDHIDFSRDEAARTSAFLLAHPTTAGGDRLADEAGAVMIVRMLSEAFGPRLQMSELAFAFGANGLLQAYRDTVGIKPTFERGGETMIAFSRDMLDLRARQPDVARFRAAELYFEHRRRLIERSESPAALAELSAAIARRAEFDDYSAPGAAREANLSVRTAQRIAARHGRTLSGMIDEARAAKAQRLIAHDPEAPLVVVATSVGYSDERAFRRAFKRWTEMTPSDYRRLMRPAAALG